MAKGEYQKWLKPDNLLLLQGWKRNGLTDEQIAKNVGINVRTLSKWKAKYGQIGQALKIGKDKANFAVENKLFKKAMQGNTAAIIFWLKNNMREKYSERPKTKAEKELDQAQTELALAQKRQAIEATKTSTQKRNALSEKLDKISSDDLRAYMKAYREKAKHGTSTSN